MKRIPLQVKAGVTIYASNGLNGQNAPDRMSSRLFYLAEPGSRLRLLDPQYLFNVATYAGVYDEKYRHTYEYAPEQSWTSYNQDLGGDTYRQEEYVFSERCYFRVCLKRQDGRDFTVGEAAHIAEILCFESFEEEKIGPALFFLPEIEKTTAKIEALRDSDAVVFAVLTDTHRTVNGTWPDTIQNLRAVHDGSPLDALIHLGDFTDGMMPRDVTYHYVEEMLADMQSVGAPFFAVLGNHDANYFQGNPDVFPLTEQVQLYQQACPGIRPAAGAPYYYQDYARQQLRCIFLSAYENSEALRYGFDRQQIEWVYRTLEELPADWRVLVFSHDAPLARLDFWAEEIRNGDRLMDVLETWQRQHQNLLGYIHGHTHADFIYTRRAFPIISIGCAKCEDMQEKKPKGARTPLRMPGTVSQELWDVLVVHPERKTLDFIRFGAGEDRHIEPANGLLHRLKKMVRGL